MADEDEETRSIEFRLALLLPEKNIPEYRTQTTSVGKAWSPSLSEKATMSTQAHQAQDSCGGSTS